MKIEDCKVGDKVTDQGYTEYRGEVKNVYKKTVHVQWYYPISDKWIYDKDHCEQFLNKV